jgi:hypothetical protein
MSTSLLSVRPLTLAEVDAMDSKTFDWHTRHNLANVDKALNPPPPPAPPSESEVRAARVAALVAEYEAYVKKHGGGFNLLTFEGWQKEKSDAATLKEVEDHVQRWLDKHAEDYVVSDSNKDALNGYLSKHDLPVTFENLEKAFTALVASGDLAVNPPDNSPRSGFWRNGEWNPMAGQPRSHFLGQLDPSKVASGEKQVTKRVSQQSASEFLSNLSSRSFHKKMDESLL